MYDFWPIKRWQLCSEIENVFGGIPACFVYVLWKFSGFPWQITDQPLSFESETSHLIRQ